MQAPGFSFASAAPPTSLPKTASTPLFGLTPSSAPGAFGAASTPGGWHGGRACPTHGRRANNVFLTSPPLPHTHHAAALFGPTTGASAPFSFSPAAPQSQPSLFGAQPAASAAAPSLFGAQPAAATPTPLLGGGFSPFGAAPQQQQQQQMGLALAQPLAFGAGGAAAPQHQQPQAVPDLSAINELEGIRHSYQAGPAPPAGSGRHTKGEPHPRFRFQQLLLNVVTDPAQRVKPAGVDELQWREALARAGGPDNADHLWPVLAQGFDDLLARCVPRAMGAEGRGGA